MDRPRGATCATGERSRGGGTRRAPVRERRTRRGDRVGSLLGGCARARRRRRARDGRGDPRRHAPLRASRGCPPGAPEEPTVPGPRAFGLRNEARGDVGGVIPSPAPAPWNEPWPKTRVPGARFHHILDEELIAGSVSPRGPRARRRDVLREVQRALPDHDRDGVDVSGNLDDLERRARASGVFRRFATPSPVFSGESRDARAGTGTGKGTGTGSSDIFDRSLRYPGVHSPYESKGETTEEATRRRGGGGVASAEEARRRRIRDKAAALENLREVRRALGKSSPPR